MKNNNATRLLDGWSPFQTELGDLFNMARIGLGEERGWLELYRHGELKLYASHYPDEPVFSFNAEDASVLLLLAQELITMAEAWQEYQKESASEPNPGEMADDEKQTAGRPASHGATRRVKNNGLHHKIILC